MEVRDGLKIITETEKGVKEYLCDLLLVVTGRTPNIAGLNLESAGVEYNNKGIIVNSNYQTTAKGVYAIGDVIGGQMLAHVASEEGKVCVENIYGIKSSIDYDAIPSCVFSFPEVAVVGLTEEAAKERGLDYIVGKAVFAGNGKAMTLEETDGFIKVIAERVTHKLFGVHIIGPHASDLIHEAALAISQGMSIKQIGETVHAHPTLAEALGGGTSAKGEAIHILPKK